ncbi:MAG: type II toxin-antitoxin system HicB family antitoxin [Thermoguttaceae bacterium]
MNYPVVLHKDKRSDYGVTVPDLPGCRLRVNAKRINITIPERTLDAIDRFAQEHGQTRSGLLTEAAVTYMGRPADHGRPRRA